MAEVGSTGVSHMCDNSTVSVNLKCSVREGERVLKKTFASNVHLQWV